MKPFLSWPVRAHLMMLLSAAIIPALIVILVAGFERERSALQLLQQNAEARVETVADEYTTTVAETRQMLSILTALPEVRSADPEPCQKLFERLLQRSPQFNSLQLSRDGQIFASGSPLPGTVRVDDRKYYKDAVARRGFGVGEYIIGRTVVEPQLNFSYAVLDTNASVIGVVQAGYSLNYFAALIRGCKLPPDARALVTDHAGTIINVFPPDRELIGKKDDPALFDQMTAPNGTFRYGAGTNRQFAAYRQLRLGDNPYLYIRLAMPEAPMLAQVRAVLWENLLLLGLAAALAILAAKKLGNSAIVHPVQALVQAMQKFGAGDLTARVTLVRGGRELQELAHGFNRMADLIVTRESEREKDKEKLAYEEKRYRLLFNSTADSVFVHEVGPDLRPGNFVEVNDAACARLGYSREEFARMTPEAIDKPGHAFGPKLAQQLASTGVVSWEGVHLARDGRSVPCEITARLFELDGRRMALSTAHEIFERKLAEQEKSRLENELRHAQKMEAIGRLAGGVAHDFNNLLTAIMGNAELVLEEPLEESVRSGVEEIRRVSIRAASLTRQLLTFSRKQVVSPAVVDLNAVISQSSDMITRLIGEHIELSFHPGPSLWRVLADPSQIDQVLVNLAVNSRDAMPRGGRLVVETRNVVVEPDGPVPFSGCTPGEWVSMSISDNGCGMTLETQQRIFEPFFTTKDKGKGTGLGLATVYGIVKHCGGGISVNSEVDIGTRFTLYFPRNMTKTVEEQEGTAFLEKETGTESILLVEDEPAVREPVRRALEKHGYRVVTAADGFIALTLFDPQNTDILLTDVLMPGMNGYDLYRAICTLKPGLKVLYMSGHIDDEFVQSEVTAGKAHFIAKPFKTADLMRKLRYVLNGESSAA